MPLILIAVLYSLVIIAAILVMLTPLIIGSLAIWSLYKYVTESKPKITRTPGPSIKPTQPKGEK